jgi:hypothetical protein
MDFRVTKLGMIPRQDLQQIFTELHYSAEFPRVHVPACRLAGPGRQLHQLLMPVVHVIFSGGYTSKVTK